MASIATSAPSAARDMNELFPRSASFVQKAPPSVPLQVIKAFRATSMYLPGSYYGSEAEAVAALLATAAKSDEYNCVRQGASLTQVADWTVFGAHFTKEMRLDYVYVCPNRKVASSEQAWIGADYGCADIDDEIRSQLADGKLHTPYDPAVCVHSRTIDRPPSCGASSSGSSSSGPSPGFRVSATTFGNPINFALGRKILVESDYAGVPSEGLSFQRYYEVHVSTPLRASRIGKDWSHSFNRVLLDSGYHTPGIYSIGISEPNGHWTWFTQSGTDWVSMFDPDDRVAKVDLGSGNYEWRRQGCDRTIEVYDAAGRNIRLDSPGGRSLALAYDAADRLVSVTNSFGRRLLLAYDVNGQLRQLTLPDASAITYAYTSSAQLLTTVQFSDARTRAYAYDSTRRLTGVTDENGSAYLSATYNYYGKAIASSLSGNVNRFQYTAASSSGGTAYVGNEGGTSSFGIVTPLGSTITIGTINVNFSARPATVSEPCATCGLTSAAFTYDANGNVASRSDFNNRKVCYAHDPGRNLEIARAEGILATETCSTVLATLPTRADVRKVSTQWHVLWRLPTAVAEPDRLTTFAYNGDGGMFCAPTTALVNGNPIGVLCKKTVQATTDATGQAGLGASVSGAARVWQYTYDAFGQLLTATDPNNNITTTAYYAATDPDPGKRGNVQTITNPLGHVTTITAYDLNGRPTSITDPNGTVTTLTYHPRGWLTSRTVGGEITAYDYDGVGQLIRVTMPDASYVAYTYDGAHRLTQLQDGLGNKIVYTLDAMGNRIKEEARDPGGTLARVRQQVFDSLNRLHQSVGAQ
jgi:YD repeat-containing protein